MPSVRKGDTVQMLSGKDRGKQGRVVRVWPSKGKVQVEGVNQVKRHEKLRVGRGRAGTEGGIVTKDMPVHVCTVALVCGSCHRPTRAGSEPVEGGGKRRVCRKCGGAL